jgi:hypothetical protein
LALSDEDIAALAAISRSRTEPASRVERARMLLSASKEELKARIMAAMDEFNRHPIVNTWSYKLDRAA